MKTHTTNYFDTFIEVAEDTKASEGMQPISKGQKKTIAAIQYDLLAQNPYHYTSDDIIFQAFAERNDLTQAEYKEARENFFSNGQPCLRTSPLAKTYGFGIHHDNKGKVAIYGIETKEYKELLENDKVKKVKAMRSSKK